MHVGLFYTFRQRFSSLNMDLFENSEDIQELRCLPLHLDQQNSRFWETMDKTILTHFKMG